MTAASGADEELPVSVIVASHGRPAALARCLDALTRLFCLTFEIVVVTDAEGRAAVERTGLAGRLKLVAFDAPNLSQARNLGVAAAAGEIVAFIDDDAVPEPTWLDALAGAFGSPDVAAAGGTVLGRNGISVQWGPREVNALGEHRPLATDGHEIAVFEPPAGRGVRTEGTNMAVRRSVLTQLGGFDPALRFFLEDTDLNLRLAREGHMTAIVPGAVVHHGFDASARRRADRVPRSLFEEGASLAVFLRRHAPEALEARFAVFRGEQRARLLRHMVAGRIEPRDVGRLMASLGEGWEDGKLRPLQPLPPLGHAERGFLPFEGGADRGLGVVAAGWAWNARRLRAEAAEAARDGATVSLFLFSPTAWRHRVRFTEAGVWEQAGGLWGLSERTAPRGAALTLRRRLRREAARVAPVRGLQVSPDERGP
jgi:GT2 family glycosyltransferase